MIEEEKAKDLKYKYFNNAKKGSSLDLIKKMYSEDKEEFIFIMKYFKPEGVTITLLQAVYSGKTNVVHRKLSTTLNAVTSSYMQMYTYIGEFLDDIISGESNAYLYNTGAIRDCYDFHYIQDFQLMNISEMKYVLGKSILNNIKGAGVITLGDFVKTCKDSKSFKTTYSKIKKLLKDYVNIDTLAVSA